MRISDWSSDVCSSDLVKDQLARFAFGGRAGRVFSVDQLDPRAGNRLSHDAGLVEALKGVATEDRAASGAAISLHQIGPGHRIEPPLDRQRQGRGPGNGKAHGGRVNISLRRVTEERRVTCNRKNEL